LIDALNGRQESGGVWRVIGRHPTRVTVTLLRYDAGKVVDLITSGDPDWLAYLNGRHGNNG
jgi:hypothetical protein